MWQYQKLSMLLALGVVAISSSTGCAVGVDDPAAYDDELAMSGDDTAESSEALTAGGAWGGGAFLPPGIAKKQYGFGAFGGYGYGGYGHGAGFGYGDYGYGGYGAGYGGYGAGYGGYGAGYGDYGYGGYGGYASPDIDIYVEQNNGYGGGYGGYLPPPVPVAPVAPLPLPLPIYDGCGAYGGYGGYGYGGYDDGWN